MRKLYLLPAFALVGSILLVGCNSDTASKASKAPGKEQLEEIKAARAKLSPEDRKLVEAQEYCAIMTDNRLGDMGEPLKVMVNDQPVFLCCKGCKNKALANPVKTLATVESLKAKVSADNPRK